MAETNAVPDSLEALPDVQAAPEDKTLPKLDSAPKSGFMSSLWDVLKTDAAVKRHAVVGAAADIVGAVGAKGLASDIRSAAPLPKPETEAGVRVQRYETRYIDDVREQEKQISSAIANGTSAAQEPGRSAWELIQVPIQGTLHGATSIGNFVPAPQPTTALGREWNAWGMLFAPLTESVHAGEQEYNADTDHPSPWMHYAFEAGSFGTMILGGKGLGELGGAVGRATGVLDKDIPVAHSTTRDVPDKVRVPTRPGAKPEAPSEPVAEPKDTLFDTGDAEIEREAARQAERDKFHDLNRAREQDRETPEKPSGPPNLYHGTSSDVREFDDERLGQNTGHMTAPLGHFFAEDVRKAKAYAEKASNYVPVDERVIKAQVDIHHPKEMSLQDLMDIDSQDESRTLRARLMKEGYDGIHIPEIGQWVAFTGKQIHIIDPAEEAFERTANAQADSILDYQNTLSDAAQARLDDADFEAASQSAERTDELLRGGGAGHAGTSRGEYTGDWHEYLNAVAQLAGVEPQDLRLRFKELELIGREPGEFDDLETLSHETPIMDEQGFETLTPRAKGNLASLKAKRSLVASDRNALRKFRSGLYGVYSGATTRASEAHIAHVAQTMALGAAERERMDVVNTGIRKVFARMTDEDLAAWWRHFQKGAPMPDP